MLWNDFAIKLIEIDFENTMIEEEIWIIMAQKMFQLMREYFILVYNRTFKGFEYFTPPKIPTCYYLRFNTKK